MTDEQELKAIYALLEKNLKNIKKNDNAKKHLRSIEAVKKYNLPYRVYFKQEYEENEIHINPFYPLESVPKEHEWNYLDYFETWEAYMQFITKPTDERTPDGQIIHIFDTSEVDAIKAAAEEPYRPCRMDTEAGRNNWKKYFTKFLLPYKEDIKTWKSFDFFGTTDHTAEEVEEARQYYLSLIAECEAHPEKYELKPIYKK